MRLFYLTYPIPNRGKDKNQIGARKKTNDVIVTLNGRNHAISHHSLLILIQKLLEAF